MVCTVPAERGLVYAAFVKSSRTRWASGARDARADREMQGARRRSEDVPSGCAPARRQGRRSARADTPWVEAQAVGRKRAGPEAPSAGSPSNDFARVRHLGGLELLGIPRVLHPSLEREVVLVGELQDLAAL